VLTTEVFSVRGDDFFIPVEAFLTGRFSVRPHTILVNMYKSVPFGHQGVLALIMSIGVATCI
jgi:hypothetical protein